LSDGRIRDSVRNSTVKGSTLKATLNDPALRGKLRMELNEPTEGVIYWYIKFNIALDPDSVSKDTMYITETNGYILDASITYDSDRNVIVINPLDPFAEDEFYVLTITRQVKSSKGVNMKKIVNILFKIFNNKISDFKIMKDNEKVAKPKPKPEHLKRELAEKNAHKAAKGAGDTGARHYTFMKDDVAESLGERLPSVYPKINFWVALTGLALIIIAIIIQVYYFYYVSLAVAGLGIFHIIAQLLRKDNRSTIFYILGASSFYDENYKKAKKRFERALQLNPLNEYAEFGLSKLSYYLNNKH
jgi:hypothetical protein